MKSQSVRDLSDCDDLILTTFALRRWASRRHTPPETSGFRWGCFWAGLKFQFWLVPVVSTRLKKVPIFATELNRLDVLGGCRTRSPKHRHFTARNDDGV